MRKFSADMLFLWIILYGLVFHLSSLPLPPWVFPLCLLVFSSTLLWWCCSGKRRKRLGLTRPVLSGKGLLWGLLRLHFRSLLPCLLAHFFVNLTAAAPPAVDISLLFPGLCICCVLMVGSSIPLYQRIIHGGAYEEEKTAHPQYIILSNQWQIGITNGTTFLAAQWASVKDSWRNLNSWELYSESIVLDQYQLPGA